MANYTYNSIRKGYDDDKELNKKLDEKIKANNTIYDTNAQTIRNTYNQQIEDTEDDYEDAHRENAVQQKVNEHYIAEEMANMGLTDSGLNRTQITANQLSYANNKAKLDRQRQSFVDGLTLEMTNRIAENENSRLSSEQSIRDADSQYRDSLATSEYNTRVEQDAAKYKADMDYKTKIEKANIDAQTEITKAGIKAAGNGPKGIISGNNKLLSRNYTGLLEESGVSVIFNDDETTTYIDRKTGYKSTFNSNVNPYTNTVNPDTEYGVFTSTGYQPTHKNGVKLSKADTTYLPSLGRSQNVFKGEYIENGKTVTKYWLWDDSINDYQQVYKSNGKWVIKN